MPKTINLGWGLSRSRLRSNFRVFGLLVFAAFMLAVNGAHAQTTNYVLGTTNLLVGPAAGTNSVVLGVTPATGTWTATANTNWLHLSLANQSGTGSTNVIFSYDANLGATRAGSLTVGDQRLTLTQAGSTYVAAGAITALATSGMEFPEGVAVDGVGNVYICDNLNHAVKKWTATNNTLTTLISSNLSSPGDLVLDGAGNIYISDAGSGIKKWTAFNSSMTTLVSAPMETSGLAVDSAGDLYLSESFPENDIVKRIVGTQGGFHTAPLTLVAGLDWPSDVRLDVAGNLYISSQGDWTLKKWTAANSNLTTLVSSGLNTPSALAVDGSGNVYIADFADNAIKMWAAANGNLLTLTPGFSFSQGVAVDGAGNVFFSDANTNQPLNELPHAFVDPTPMLEGLADGSDALPAVLPTSENLLPPFAPGSDQAWLTITGITNGVVSFSFTANTGSARTAHISLLGQSIPITQGIIGTSPTMTDAQILGDGVVQFVFSNNPSASFTVLSSTNLSLPLGDWTVVGTASNTAPGVFQFTSAPTTNDAQRFYSVRSP